MREAARRNSAPTTTAAAARSSLIRAASAIARDPESASQLVPLERKLGPTKIRVVREVIHGRVNVGVAMPFHCALSLMLKNGHGRRREEEMLRAFREADRDGDGYLSYDEYAAYFLTKGCKITQAELRAVFHSKDRDLDGRISFDEFCDQETVNERAFRAMDINNDGFVSKEEMLRTTTRLSPEDVEVCFREFDADRDNMLNYEEFCSMMNTRRHSMETMTDHGHSHGHTDTAATANVVAGGNANVNATHTVASRKGSAGAISRR